MNSFGSIFRVTIWGESHGECVGVSIDGVPAGIALSVEDFAEDLVVVVRRLDVSPISRRSFRECMRDAQRVRR